ncbi:MAG: VOC family protein [Pseudomonadota bacterium]
MPLHPKFGAVIYAKDLASIARFYAELLSMDVVHREPDHTVLESSDLQLVLHGIPQHVADTFEITSPPERRTDTAIKLFFTVADLVQARATAARLGGCLNDPDQEWEWAAQGVRACDGHDPEGNVFQLRVAIA